MAESSLEEAKYAHIKRLKGLWAVGRQVDNVDSVDQASYYEIFSGMVVVTVKDKEPPFGGPSRLGIRNEDIF